MNRKEILEQAAANRLTKRVGVGEAIPITDNDICAPFKRAGLCKTGCLGGVFSKWERHCNDECILGMMIDKLAVYEDIGPPSDLIRPVRCGECKQHISDMAKQAEAKSQKEKAAWSCFDGFCCRYLKYFKPDDFCSYGERRAEE